MSSALERWRATLAAVGGSPPPVAAATPCPGQLRLALRTCGLEPLWAWLERQADPFKPGPRRCSCGRTVEPGAKAPPPRRATPGRPAAPAPVISCGIPMRGRGGMALSSEATRRLGGLGEQLISSLIEYQADRRLQYLDTLRDLDRAARQAGRDDGRSWRPW